MSLIRGCFACCAPPKKFGGTHWRQHPLVWSNAFWGGEIKLSGSNATLLRLLSKQLTCTRKRALQTLLQQRRVRFSSTSCLHYLQCPLTISSYLDRHPLDFTWKHCSRETVAEPVGSTLPVFGHGQLYEFRHHLVVGTVFFILTFPITAQGHLLLHTCKSVPAWDLLECNRSKLFFLACWFKICAKIDTHMQDDRLQVGLEGAVFLGCHQVREQVQCAIWKRSRFRKPKLHSWRV